MNAPEETRPRADEPGAALVDTVRGASIAALARLGGVIEVVAAFVFLRLYGIDAVGLFLLLWAYVEFLSYGADLGMTAALQRFVPGAKDAEGAGRAVGLALAVTLAVSGLVAAVIYGISNRLSPMIQAPGAETAALGALVRLYVWAVPLWAFLRVSAAALQAERAYGADTRLRIVYEKVLRVGLGVLFGLMGFDVWGLVYAHLIALGATDLIAARRLFRQFPPRTIFAWPAPEGQALPRDMTAFASLMLLPRLNQKVISDLPVFLLNALARPDFAVASVAVYVVLRKIVSALQLFTMTFEYALAPIVAGAGRIHDMAATRNMYRFATRLEWILFLPFGILLIAVRDDILVLAGPDFLMGSAAMVILVIGNGARVASGPASAIIAMIGRYALPFTNAVLADGAELILLILLVPSLGVTGAAVAAAAALALWSITAFVELIAFHELQPYERRTLRPVALAAAASVGAVSILALIPGISGVARIAAAAALYVVVTALALFMGCDAEDRNTLTTWSRRALRR